jgi:hypothetical protein
MKLIRPVAAAAVIALLAAPSVASTSNPAARLSLALDSADSGDASSAESDGGSNLPVILGIGGAAVIGLAVALGDNDNKPASS